MAATYDIAILGATPAGLAAAHWLARKGCRTVVLDAPQRDAECPFADWVPADFFQIEGMPRSLSRKCRAEPFDAVCYHNADLSQAVMHRTRRVAGHFLQTKSLGNALKAAAVAAGAKVRAVPAAPAIQLKEDVVQLVGGPEIQARFLLVTHGNPAEAAGDLSMPVPGFRHSPLVVVALEVPLPGKRAGKLGRALHMVESRDRTELGMFFACAGVVHLRIISFSRASGNRAAELSLMIANLQRAGLLPSSLRLGKARGAIWHPPAGAAAETESHVAKRCLIGGTAGGFVDSITGHTLAPSVRSAVIAAKTVLAALKSTNPQGTLSQYKTAWRRELGDYLRPLSASLQMLLPLVLVNKRLVSRLTGAILFGQKI
jgi:flavin-dependent dehydrogenase